MTSVSASVQIDVSAAAYPLPKPSDPKLDAVMWGMPCSVRVMVAQGEHLMPDYLAVNPHARVPALSNGGGIITENIAILNFIADVFSKPGSVPRGDVRAAAQTNELLGWFASSVHISFAEIWREHGLDQGVPATSSILQPVMHLGALTGGFTSESGRFVVVTDAEIFGRYKIQRPRRLKSPHAAAARSD